MNFANYKHVEQIVSEVTALFRSERKLNCMEGNSDEYDNSYEYEDTFEETMAENIFFGANNIEAYVAGENFESWIERVEIVLKINKVADNEKTDYMISMGGADLFQVAKSLISPKTLADVKYEELKHLRKESDYLQRS